MFRKQINMGINFMLEDKTVFKGVRSLFMLLKDGFVLLNLMSN